MKSRRWWHSKEQTRPEICRNPTITCSNRATCAMAQEKALQPEITLLWTRNTHTQIPKPTARNEMSRSSMPVCVPAQHRFINI
ncbi:hypothetical protein PoB_002622400 [Plakobranchus ocellatus]|uniref:Uncharacterized protein n=1 Tax=Plakobranchus ocellatus TaxID=259542 RepID=A0AAV3ZWM5_9GAST|nr:hypothetical protein PoB_002622400 [Plakobranchus ocellatus]